MCVRERETHRFIFIKICHAHHYGVLNLYELLSSTQHKRRYCESLLGGQLSAEQACLRAKSYLFLKVTVLVFVVLPTHITDLTKTTDQAKLT